MNYRMQKVHVLLSSAPGVAQHMGNNKTRRLVKEISQYVPDMIIVSGLAKGIDTVAHETALEFGLKTISVLAGGLQHIYPPENKNPG